MHGNRPPDRPRKVLGLTWYPVTVMGPRKRSVAPMASFRQLWRKLHTERIARPFPGPPASAREPDVPGNATAVGNSTLVESKDLHAGAKHRTRYGLIVYDGAFFNNIGDEMQSMAAMKFLPSIDHLIPIDKLTSLAAPEPGSPPVKVIMNGYFTCNPDAWPPPDWIQPLFVSFHLSDIPYGHYGGRSGGSAKAASEVLLSGRNLHYFKRHEPIGCRDQMTVERFKSVGVQAYFTGCMTLTLQSRWHRSRDKICLVDVSGNVSTLIDSIPRHLRDEVVVITHDLNAPGKMSQIERYAAAHELLTIYSSARLVVTSRLHCALPCLAVGTSVLFVKPQQDTSRFGGLEELLNTIAFEDIANGWIDWDAPPPNPTQHLVLAEQLTKTCRSFVGEQCGRSVES